VVPLKRRLRPNRAAVKSPEVRSWRRCQRTGSADLNVMVTKGETWHAVAAESKKIGPIVTGIVMDRIKKGSGEFENASGIPVGNVGVGEAGRFYVQLEEPRRARDDKVLGGRAVDEEVLPTKATFEALTENVAVDRVGGIPKQVLQLNRRLGGSLGLSDNRRFRFGLWFRRGHRSSRRRPSRATFA
jgi:hypothetical protein